MNTLKFMRAPSLQQFQQLGEKLNRSLRKELQNNPLRQEVLNAKVKRSYPRPKAA